MWQVLGSLVLILSVFGASHGLAQEKNLCTIMGANLREGPGIQGAVLRVVPKGTVVAVLSQKGEWYQVELKDQTQGWLYKDMLTEEMPKETKLAQAEEIFKSQGEELAETRQRLETHIQLNQSLGQQLGDLQKKTESQAAQLQLLEKSEKIKFTALGACILLVGWLLGWVTNKFKGRPGAEPQN